MRQALAKIHDQTVEASLSFACYAAAKSRRAKVAQLFHLPFSTPQGDPVAVAVRTTFQILCLTSIFLEVDVRSVEHS